MSFYTEIIMPDHRFHSLAVCNDLALLEPVTRAAVQAIVTEAAAAGQPVMVFETFRSQERQDQVFAAGASSTRNAGVHHMGLAADIVRAVGGQPSWKGDFTFLRGLAIRHGMVWGGDWGNSTIRHPFVDADHVQRVTLADQPRLFAGTWYPDETYQPVVI